MVDEARKQESREWLEKGVAALKAKNFRLARQHLLRAKDLDPENAEAWLYLTGTTRDLKKRKALLLRVLKLQPDHAKARQMLAKIERQMVPHFEDEYELPPAPEKSPPPAEDDEDKTISSVKRRTKEMPKLDLAQAAAPAEELQADAPAEAPVQPVAATPEPVEPAEPEIVEEDNPPEEEPALPAAPDSGKADEVLAELSSLAMPTMDEMVADDVVEEVPAEVVERCPRCGAVMRADDHIGGLVCVFCGYGMADQGPGAGTVVERQNAGQEWPAVKQARHCLTCDTISIPPAGVTADIPPCPVCGQAIFEPVESGPALPEGHLPFEVDEARAAIAIENKQTGRLQLFRRQREMTRPQRVFLPVWLFSAAGTASYMLPDTEEGQSLEHAYEQVVVHCVPQFDENLLHLASQVDYDALEPFASEQGDAAFVLLPNLPLNTAAIEARQLINGNLRSRVRQAHPQAEIGSVDVADLTAQLVMLPVWINVVSVGSQLHTGMISGVTAQAAVGGRVRRPRR
jgi:ribosomal protein S27AE